MPRAFFLQKKMSLVGKIGGAKEGVEPLNTRIMKSLVLITGWGRVFSNKAQTTDTK